MTDLIAGLATAAALLAVPATGAAHIEPGAMLENVEMSALDGSRQPLLVKDKVNLLVFVRPGQDRSVDTMERLAECEKMFTGKPVRLVALISSTVPIAEARSLVLTTGVRSPVVIDQGDALYGKLELRQHPMAVIIDRKWKIHAFEPYQRLRYCEIVRARVRFLLGELDMAEVEKIVKPPRADFPNEVAGARAKRYVKLGEKEMAKGNCTYALQSFDIALTYDPQNAEALAGKAKCQGKGAATPAARKP